MFETKALKLKTVFVGSKKLGFSSLKILRNNPLVDLIGIVTFDDLEDTRTYFVEFKEFAETHNYPLHLIRTDTLKNVNADLENVLLNIKPDFTFVVGWYWKLFPKVLALSTKGIYGIHSADLPNYKGSAPLVWALIFGEKRIGVSLFRFAQELDKGEVFAKMYFPAKDRYINDILKDIDNSLELLIGEGIENIIQNQTVSLPPDDGLYYLARTAEDAHIQWHQSSEQINRFIRAQSCPYPGAYFYYGNEKFKVFESDLVESEYRYVAVPGSIFTVQKKYLKVACEDGYLIKLSNIHNSAGEISDLKYCFPDKKVRLK